MIEIDLLFTSINRKKNYQIEFLGLFWSAQRSDEILEVGGINIPLMQFNLN
jgi:hypothetical protein